MWEEHLKRLTLFGLVSALSICQIAYASDVATDSNAVRVEDDVGADNKEEEQTGNEEEQTGDEEEQTGDEELINDLDYSGVYIDNGAEQIDINSLNDATVYGATETSETTTENNVAVKVPYIVRIDGNGIKTAFEIKVIGTLNETSTLYVYLDESVELTTYLKAPIYGTVTQDKYSINSSDLEVGGGTDIINADITLEKYITAGEWKGNLGIEVYLEDLGTTEAETLEASTFAFDVPEMKEEITEGTAEMDGELEKTESEDMELESLPDESEAGNSEKESLPAETEAESSEQETGNSEQESLTDESEGEELGTESTDTESTDTESTDTESLPEETEETVESTEETESDYMEEEIIDIPEVSLPEETTETDSGTTDTENEATSEIEEAVSEEASDVSETTL